jgi:hypothetical protein
VDPALGVITPLFLFVALQWVRMREVLIEAETG